MKVFKSIVYDQAQEITYLQKMSRRDKMKLVKRRYKENQSNFEEQYSEEFEPESEKDV